MRRSGLLLFLLAALACGRSTGQGVGQQPVTLASVADSASRLDLACVDTALSTSSYVERLGITRQGDPPGSRYVMLRNPPGPRSGGMRFSAEPRQLVVEFTWPGPWQGRNGMQPVPDAQASEMEGEGLTSIGSRLLLVVRAACAPDATGQPVCSRVAQGRSGRCVLGI